MTARKLANGKQLHGEFKVPGGKLVIADLDVTEGKISRANINGDFFLEPDEALDDIKHALMVLHYDASNSQITKTLDSSLDDSVVMCGFDAHAVATAVRSATGFATSWEDHDWDVILPTEIPIYTQVALDQVLTEDVAAGRARPEMRLWRWPRTASAGIMGSVQGYGT